MSSKKTDLVRKLIGSIPVKNKHWTGFQLFHRLRLISLDGTQFALSIQGSMEHQCSPPESFSSLLDYETIEVAFMSDRPITEEVSVTGFNRTGANRHGEILQFVPIRDVIDDLCDFFESNGFVDGSHDETKEWVNLLNKEAASLLCN